MGVLIKHVFFLTLLSFTSSQAEGSDSIVVVANTQHKSIKLSHQEIRNLFMGAALSYDLRVIALPPENQTRVKYNTKVIELTESRNQSYWHKYDPASVKNQQQN